MSELSSALANQGAKHSFDFEGKTFTLRYLDQYAKSEFEKHLFKRARALAEITDEGKSDEVREKHLLALNDKFLAGDYALESPLGLKHLNTASGQLFLARLLIGCTDNELLKIFAGDKRTEVLALIQLVLAESLPKAGKSNPNGETPVS